MLLQQLYQEKRTRIFSRRNEIFQKNFNHKYERDYILLKDFNDLLMFFNKDDRIKTRTYNPIELGSFEKPSNRRYEVLSKLLNERKIHNSKFDSVEDEINVGCGQMFSKKLEKIRRC